MYNKCEMCIKNGAGEHLNECDGESSAFDYESIVVCLERSVRSAVDKMWRDDRRVPFGNKLSRVMRVYFGDDQALGRMLLPDSMLSSATGCPVANYYKTSSPLVLAVAADEKRHSNLFGLLDLLYLFERIHGIICEVNRLLFRFAPASIVFDDVLGGGIALGAYFSNATPGAAHSSISADSNLKHIPHISRLLKLRLFGRYKLGDLCASGVITQRQMELAECVLDAYMCGAHPEGATITAGEAYINTLTLAACCLDGDAFANVLKFYAVAVDRGFLSHDLMQQSFLLSNSPIPADCNVLALPELHAASGLMYIRLHQIVNIRLSIAEQNSASDIQSALEVFTSNTSPQFTTIYQYL